MTSVVKSAAHPAGAKVLVVQVWNGEELVSEKVLKNGEADEALAYDDRKVVVFEREAE